MTLHVETIGQGPDLVLLHGWGMHSGVWLGVQDVLASRFRLHLIDLPGMGLSPSCEPYTLERLAREVAGQMPEHATVCGWSFGGEVAMRLALDYPARVDQLILVGSTPCFVNGQAWGNGIAAQVFSDFAAQVAAEYHGSMGRFLGLQAFGGKSSRTQLRELREHFASRPVPALDVLQQALKVLLETDLRGQVSKLDLPVQIIHGDRDTLAPVASAYWMAEHLPMAALNVIHGASHAPFLSHPTEFSDLVMKFSGQTQYAR